MHKSFRRNRRSAIILATILTSSLFGQGAVDAVRPFYGSGGPGSRSEGLAQAFTAIADDGAALHYNPAGLAFQTNIEINLGLNHLIAGTEGSGDNTNSISATRLGNLSIVMPGEGTKWTFAMGLHSVRAFERARKITISGGNISHTEAISEAGQLASLAFGVGYQISPTVAFGGAVNIIGGSSTYDEITIFSGGITPSSHETLLHIQPHYRGISAKFGLLIAPTRFWRLGVMIQSPQTLNVEETSYDDLDPSEYTVSYKTRQSYQMRFGTSLNMGPLLLAADVFWQDYSQIRFESELDDEFLDSDSNYYYLPIDPGVNSELRSNYGAIPGVALGGEFLLPKTNMKLRGGYRYQPSPKAGASVDDASGETARQTFTAGFSMLAGPGVKVDLTYSLSQWERSLIGTTYSGINPLRSSANALTANFIIRL